MSTGNDADADRGLEQPARRPVLPSDTRMLDDWIYRLTGEARAIVVRIQGATSGGEQEPPASLIGNLEGKVGKIYTLTMQRIKTMTRLGEDDIKWILAQAAMVQRMPYISEEVRDERAERIRITAGEKYSAKLLWNIDRLRRSQDTITQKIVQKDVLELLEHVGQLGIPDPQTTDDHGHPISASEYVWQKIAESEELEKKRRLESERRERRDAEEMRALISKSYGRIQKQLGDQIFAREEVRGTADRGTSGRRR